MFSQVLKINPYHDKTGAFVSKDRAVFTTKQIRASVDILVNSGADLRVRTGSVSGEEDKNNFTLGWERLTKGKVLPEDLVEAWVGADGDMNAVILSANTYDIHFKYHGPVYGAMAIEVERTLYVGKHDAYHDYLKLDPNDEGGGAVKKMFAAVVPLYKKMGLTQISTYANMDAGGYAWGKYGFKTVNRGAMGGMVSRKMERVWEYVNNGVFKPVSDEAKREILEAISAVKVASSHEYESHIITDIKTPIVDRELHDEFRHEMLRLPAKVKPSLVKYSLYSRSWDAILKFDDPIAMNRLSTYVGKKL